MPLPVRPGDWVAPVSGHTQVAKVRRAYWLGGEVLVDLVLYSRQGDRIGRASPAEGGPRTFEPACAWEGWRRIAEPRFPIALKWVPAGDGRLAARHWASEPLPDRKWIPATRRPAGGGGTDGGNFDPELEIRSRLMAAQALRDVAREMGGSQALIDKAAALEREADSFRNG